MKLNEADKTEAGNHDAVDGGRGENKDEEDGNDVDGDVGNWQ